MEKFLTRGDLPLGFERTFLDIIIDVSRDFLILIIPNIGSFRSSVVIYLPDYTSDMRNKVIYYHFDAFVRQKEVKGCDSRILISICGSCTSNRILSTILMCCGVHVHTYVCYYSVNWWDLLNAFYSNQPINNNT